METAMNEPMTIDPAPPANPGMDYYALKREGTRWVQALDWQDVVTVMRLWILSTGDVGTGWQQVDDVSDFVGHRVCFDDARPADDERG